MAPASRRKWLIALGIIYLTLIGGTLTTDFNPWTRIIHHVLVTVALILWLVVKLRRGKSVPLTPLNPALVGVFCFYLLATIFSSDPRVSLEALWLLGIHILLILVAVDLMRTYFANLVLEAVFFTASVVVLMGLIEFLGWYFGLAFLPNFGLSWFEIGGFANPIPPVVRRLSFTLNVATWLSAYLAVLFPVGLAWMLSARQKQTRWAMTLWLGGALIVELLTFSRGGLLALSISMATFSILFLLSKGQWRDHVARIMRDGRVIVGLATAILVIATVFIAWSSQNLTGRQTGDVQRLDLWRSALNMGIDYIPVGVGPYGFGRMLRTYRNPLSTADHMTTPHNALLLVWSESGLLGLLAFLVLVAVTARVAWQRWHAGDDTEKVRIAGVTSGLLGFSVHNMVDNFPVTSVLLPSLVLIAWLAYPINPRKLSHNIQRLATTVILGLLSVSLLGWALADSATVFFSRAIHFADNGQTVLALSAIGTARRMDPGMGMYAAQEAQIYGQAATRNEVSLTEALEVYANALTTYESTSDILRANYAMLLNQNGQISEARDQLLVAAEIWPRDPRYWLWIGFLEEEEGNDPAARVAYVNALEYEPRWLGSSLWEQTDLRRNARDVFISQHKLDGLTLLELTSLTPLCWPTQDLPAYYRTETISEVNQRICSGEIALHLDRNPEMALMHLDQAIATDRTYSSSYRTRAEAYLSLGDMDRAYRDAQIAAFMGDNSAYYIIGQIDELRGNLENAEQAYLDGGPVIAQRQGYDVAVYYRRGSLSLLPIFDAPEPGSYSLASWVALVRFYESQNRIAEAALIEEAILNIDPYFKDW